MRQSNLLVFNTLAVYARMVLTIPMGIMLVRFAYGELGEIDYGLWAVVGASTAIMAVVTSSLTKSGQRHLAFAIGEGDSEAVGRVFANVLAVFWTAGLSILLVGMLIAPAILAGLSIPESRETAAWWTLHFSLLIVAIQAIVTPYRATLAAHQAISVIATVEFLQTTLSLVNAYCLRYATGDKLVTFAACQALIVAVLGLYLTILTLVRIPTSRRWPYYQWSEMKDVGSFAFWSFLGNMASTLRNHGAIVLVNVLFGSAANAAVALAIRAHAFVYRAASSINISISPALITNAGRQNYKNVSTLMNLGCKLPFLAAALIFTPFVLETDYLLDLWQRREVPANTDIHTRWLCVMALSGVATWGHHAVLEAKNRLAVLTVVLISTIVAALGTAAIGCHLFAWPVWSVTAAVAISTLFLSLVARAWLAARKLEITYAKLMLDSVWPSLVAFAPCFALAAWIHAAMPAGPLRLAAVTLGFAISLVPAGWFVALAAPERDAFRDVIQRIYTKIFRRSSQET